MRRPGSAAHCDPLFNKPGKDISKETQRVDQITYLVEGNGSAVLDRRSIKIAADHMIVILKGKTHEIINKGMTR